MKSIQEMKDQVTRILNSQLETARLRKVEDSQLQICYYPETFVVVDRIKGELKLTNNVSMPTLFDNNEASAICNRIYNGHNQRPITDKVSTFYTKLELWLLVQLENVKNL